MQVPLYQVDAFTDRVFSGNPAAVCPLNSWPADTLLQAIAAENNLSETAFFVAEGDGWRLRWFTPATEVDLCGHATLAAAHVIRHHLGVADGAIHFASQSGPLIVRPLEDGLLEMDFPARAPQPTVIEDGFVRGLGAPPEEILRARDFLAVYHSEAEVRNLTPDMGGLEHFLKRTAPDGGLIVTAPADEGRDYDIVSRFFVPHFGIPEDPVTGSAHCTLVPYWARRLGLAKVTARQVSPRGGTLYCQDAGERILIAGRCADYLNGEITL